VYQRGQNIRGSLVSLKYAKNQQQQTYRVAIVVSRKVSKSAVVRNRIRRRLYEIVRKHAARITEPHDFVLSVYGEEVSTIPHIALEKMVTEQLKQAGILGASQPSGAKHGIVDEKETNT